jgi:HEAT repeat protein
MSGTASGSCAGRADQGVATGATSSIASASTSRKSQDYHTPLSMPSLSMPRASTDTIATTTNSSSSSMESQVKRRFSSPSPTAVTAGDASTNSGAGGGERGRLSSSPSPMPVGSSGDAAPPQHTVVLSPALMSSTSSSSSSSSLTGAVDSASTTTSPTASPSYQGEEEDLSNAVHVAAVGKTGGSVSANNSSTSASTGTHTSSNSNISGSGSSSNGSGNGAGAATPPVHPLSTSAVSAVAASTAAAASSALMLSPSSPSVSPTNASAANPRRSLNAAFTISPRTESDVEASEEYNSDAPRVCLDLDRRDPPVKQYCNLGSQEERRTFVTEGCVAAAKSMSTQRIIDHLVPAILTAFEADDYGESFDDCAPSIARALPQVIACMDQKTTANLTYFMGLMMELCCSAEQVVVKETIAALQLILSMVEDDVVLDLFLPFVLTMRLSFWAAPRTVAASLLAHIAMRPAVLQACGLTVTDIFNYYVESSSDAAAMVRVGVVTSLHDWVRVASIHRLTLAEIPLPLLRSLATDDLSDAVRYLLIEEIAKLAQLVGRRSTSKYLLSTYVSASVDPSWRVRFTAANHLGTMASLVLNADDLEIVLKTLAADEEPETRAAVARQLDVVVQYCSSAMIQRCCTLVVEHFAQDENPVVRRAAARHCYCFVYGNDEVVQTMCAFLAKLMEDASFVVQESAIENLGDLITSLDKSVRVAQQQAALGDSMNSNGGTTTAHATETGLSSSTSSRSSTSRRQPQQQPQPPAPSHPQQPMHSRSGRHRSPYWAARLMSAMTTANGEAGTAESNVAFIKRRADAIACTFVDKLTLLSGSRNWRIRDVVVCVTQYFPKVLSTDKFRPLTSIIFNALRDPVSAVRTQAVHSLKRVAVAYGGAWAAQTATELLQSDSLSPARAVSYMWRVVTIQCLEVLLPVVSELDAKDVLRQQLLATTVALLQQFTTDRVPNVRIATALALTKWFSWFDVTESERGAYNAAIRTLQQDTDVDVLDASQHIPYNRLAA